MSTIQYSTKFDNPLLPLCLKIFEKKFLLLLAGCVVLNLAKGQADKRLVLADKYFASGEYFTAAGLYGQYLNRPVKEKTPSDFPLTAKKNRMGGPAGYSNKLDIQFKQAESYRLANYWNEAAALYKDCFEKDAKKYAAALYWYAICQRSTGNYAVAEESLDRFINEYGTETSYQEAAKKEKNLLPFIKSQLSRPDTVLYHVQKIDAPFITEGGVYAPSANSNNNFFITATRTNFIAQAGTNPHHNRLFQSQLINGSLQNFEAVAMEGIDSSLNQGTASLSANGNYLYFTQWKKENGQSVSSIYYSTKKENGWSQPMLLASVNQQGHNSKQPFCTADGKYLFFASDREGGLGGFDVWVAPLKEDGTTGEPINVGAAINTTDNEQGPFYHNASSTLVFSSDRTPGMGGYDLFSSAGKETSWKTAENMGHPVNSSRDDVYFFASEKNSLLTNALISSDRGSECCLATYTVSKTDKKRMITGLVKDCRNDSALANAQVVMKDAAGKTWSATTGEDGRYTFELISDASQHEVSVSKEKFSDTTARVVVERSHQGWLTDTLHNAAVCIEKKFVLKVENVVTVYFDFDKSILKDRGIEQLDSIYNILTENPNATIQISGYTDGLGSEVYNKKLSDKRAKACADYLIKKGLDAARISFESFGACCPTEMELINGRDNADGRSKNRRALININKD